MKIEEKAVQLLRKKICNNCVGRQFSELLSGYSNEQRGKLIREYVAMLLDSGEKIDADLANFAGIKFRNIKVKIPKENFKCEICGNFFSQINEKTKEISSKLKGLEFSTFVVGSIPSNEMKKKEEDLWSEVGIEFVEPIKSEINREIGKRIEKIMKKRFDLKNPDVTILLDLENDKIKTNVRSLFLYGKYQKLSRGIPQTMWICGNCRGKGCTVCKGTGKLYKTSVQEEVEKELLKAVKSKKSYFHGSGREDVDARNLDWRPFVIELTKPIKRKIKMKELERKVNKSKKVKVKLIKIVDKKFVDKLKSSKMDKTYLADVIFSKPVDKKLLKLLNKLSESPIIQKTPTRVKHRRADIFRKRAVRSIKWKVVRKNRVQFLIRAESGLYIKELISGDNGRTKPSIAELIQNKSKKIVLDVVKIHSKTVVLHRRLKF